jgi:hypothetical protein
LLLAASKDGSNARRLPASDPIEADGNRARRQFGDQAGGKR